MEIEKDDGCQQIEDMKVFSPVVRQVLLWNDTKGHSGD